jgi:hypothetical protein
MAVSYIWTITFLLTKQKINCCGTVRPNHKGMPDDFRSKTLQLKEVDIRVRASGDITVGV